eukprot:1159619-Pelagomonas_calceolata.AAC.1
MDRQNALVKVIKVCVPCVQVGPAFKAEQGGLWTGRMLLRAMCATVKLSRLSREGKSAPICICSEKLYWDGARCVGWVKLLLDAFKFLAKGRLQESAFMAFAVMS